ncbi:MAG TPA: 5'-nucleotidase C-terminal domain-containing protein [Pyrinomonadaceae bacterium]|nr:5'-nucleotidase C-terminal domain-containing protein [Pyrinomonadaceae bacterium]
MFRYANKPACCAALLGFCLLFGAAAAASAQEDGGPAPSRVAAAAQSSAGGSAGTQAPAGSSAPQSAAPLNINVRASERAVDATVPGDPAVEAVIAPYSVKVRELSAPIGKLAGDLKKGGMGGGSLGNFVADALRSRAEAVLGKPVLLAVINSSVLRKNQIAGGALSASDIYELLPFENALVALDLSGAQLRRFLDVTVERRDAQSGARIVYRVNRERKKNEIVSVKLRDAGGAEIEIDPKATYTIVTIDYLVKRGGDYIILQEGSNLVPLGLTMRDAVLDYVKAETAAGRTIKATLDGRFSYDRGSAGTDTEDETP